MAGTPPPPPHDTGLAEDSAEDGEEQVDPKHAVLGDPIIGNEGILLDENGCGARTAATMPAPKGMTAAEWARHCVTHLPYCKDCPWCVASRRPNSHHRKANNAERVIPLLVADYCFLEGSTDDDHITVLVMRLYPYRVFFCN